MSCRKYTTNIKPSVLKPSQIDLDKVPNEFCDYMKGVNTRFSDICDLYLQGLSMEDVKYLTAEDLISLVPPEQYKHKLLMTIMVRRYLYRYDENNDSLCDSTDESFIKPFVIGDTQKKCYCSVK